MTNNWDTIKEELLRRWDKLSHEELDAARFNKSGILDLIRRHYPDQSEQLPPMLEQILEVRGQSFYQEHPTSVRSMETSQLQDQAKNLNTGEEVEAYEKKMAKVAQRPPGEQPSHPDQDTRG